MQLLLAPIDNCITIRIKTMHPGWDLSISGKIELDIVNAPSMNDLSGIMICCGVVRGSSKAFRQEKAFSGMSIQTTPLS